MKKHILAGFVFGAVLFLFAACSGSFGSSKSGGSNTGAEITANTDDEVIACFNAVNAFRTGDEAYYWNPDNTTKTNLVGTLSELTLDADLCKAAQIRADEIVKSFSHTRPDGSSCFTVLNEVDVSYSKAGENIAAGSRTGAATFTQWKEDNEDYDGQGHRRNMLGDFTKIGIAYTYDANSTYKYYWTMILTK